jgi:starch synthase
MRGKAACRRALAAEFGLPDDSDTPIAAVISRLAVQKGSDLIADIAPRLAELGARLVLVGTGDGELEQRLLAIAADYPEHVAVRIDFDEALAHRVEAGADLFLMPSRFEPCGLNQMYSMAYGTLPLAHAVGGLRDTNIDATPETLADRSATGFLFTDASAEALLECLGRAVITYRDEPRSWQAMVAAGMERDFGWQHAAAAYLEVYQQAMARRRVE